MAVHPSRSMRENWKIRSPLTSLKKKKKRGGNGGGAQPRLCLPGPGPAGASPPAAAGVTTDDSRSARSGGGSRSIQIENPKKTLLALFFGGGYFLIPSKPDIRLPVYQVAGGSMTFHSMARDSKNGLLFLLSLLTEIRSFRLREKETYKDRQEGHHPTRMAISFWRGIRESTNQQPLYRPIPKLKLFFHSKRVPCLFYPPLCHPAGGWPHRIDHYLLVFSGLLSHCPSLLAIISNIPYVLSLSLSLVCCVEKCQWRGRRREVKQEVALFTCVMSFLWRDSRIELCLTRSCSVPKRKGEFRSSSFFYYIFVKKKKSHNDFLFVSPILGLESLTTLQAQGLEIYAVCICF